MRVKRVRFQTPNKMYSSDSTESHSPRPYIVEKLSSRQIDLCYEYPAPQTFSRKIDAVEYFDTRNSIPYSAVQKSNLRCELKDEFKALPSSELELSMLDVNNRTNLDDLLQNNNKHNMNNLDSVFSVHTQDQYPKVSKYDDDFFLKPKSMPRPVKYGELLKSNKILDRTNVTPHNIVDCHNILPQPASTVTMNCKPTQMCMCYFSFENKENIGHLHNCCKRSVQKCNNFIWQHNMAHGNKADYLNSREKILQCHCSKPNKQEQYNCKIYKKQDEIKHIDCECSKCKIDHQYPPTIQNNSILSNTQIMEEYKKSKASSSCQDLDSYKTLAKPKREATVSDLFKIIKLQNEQLQLLQDKVERLITSKSAPALMNQNFIQEHVAVETVDQNHQKMSIGVMTSFEVVRTSTFINKGISQNQNAQIQCNRSEISIREVVTKSQKVNQNFLEGIAPCKTAEDQNVEITIASRESARAQVDSPTLEKNDDKILNELSLCNLQIDNATTPQLSPDQTLYLDVRDYSESESEDQSNIGWTYYNKVMTHVNCMLDNSEMPSSASALYRKANQQAQMQIDKSNLSVTKKVKFGDDPLGVISHNVYHPHIYQPKVPATETSLKMNALAAKYLKTPLSRPTYIQPALRTAPALDLSFGTRNYMERHQLLPGAPSTSKKVQNDMPRFLDITALKQQPKLL